MLLAILRRSQSRAATEDVVEMAQIAEPGLESDFADPGRRIGQLIFCGIDPHHVQVCRETGVQLRPENMRQARTAEPRRLGRGLHGQGLGKMAFDIIQRLLQRVVGQSGT